MLPSGSAGHEKWPARRIRLLLMVGRIRARPMKTMLNARTRASFKRTLEANGRFEASGQNYPRSETRRDLGNLAQVGKASRARRRRRGAGGRGGRGRKGSNAAPRRRGVSSVPRSVTLDQPSRRVYPKAPQQDLLTQRRVKGQLVSTVLNSDDGPRHITFYKATAKLDYDQHRQANAWPNFSDPSSSVEDAPVAIGTNLSLHEATVLDGVDKRGHTQRIATSIFLGYVSGDNTAQGGCMGVYPISATALGGMLELFSMGFQEISFNKLNIHYVNSNTTAVPGQFIISYFEDTALFPADTSSLGIGGIQDTVATSKSMVCSVWRPATYSPILQPQQSKSFTTEAGDARLETQGLLVVQAVSAIAADVVYGTLWLEIEAKIKAPRLSRQIRFPVEGFLSMIFTAYAATGGNPIIANSIAGPATWSTAGGLALTGPADPTCLWVGSLRATTGATPPFFIPEDGRTIGFIPGMPVYLRSSRVVLGVTDQQTISMFASYEAASTDGTESNQPGELSPGQYAYTTTGVYTFTLVMHVRRIVYDGDG